eukprot:1421305-Amphidinium_carterae.2
MDSQLESGTLTSGNASTMRGQLHCCYNVARSLNKCLVNLGHTMTLARVQRDHNAQYTQYVSHIYRLVRTEQSGVNLEQIPRG